MKSKTFSDLNSKADDFYEYFDWNILMFAFRLFYFVIFVDSFALKFVWFVKFKLFIYFVKSFHLENDSVLCTKLVKHKERLMCAQTMSSLDIVITGMVLLVLSFSVLFFFSFIIIIMNYESSYKANNGNDDIFTSIHFHNLFAAAAVAVNHVLCKASHAIL